MTKEEAAAIVHAAPSEIQMSFRPVDNGMVALKALPCPLFAFNRCLVYAVRPFNCRRYVCLRPDVKAEPFDGDRNMMDRVKTSRVARRIAERHQRKAQRWARTHGWTNEATE